MHLGHKRANSFSSTNSATSKNNEQQLPVDQPTTNHLDLPSILPPPPPPTAFIQSARNRSNSSHYAGQSNFPPPKSTYFERRAEERRSFTGHYSSVDTAIRASSKPYKGVTIPRATPANVRFSVNPDIEDWLTDMSRPRSPSKSWKNGVSDAGVPSLDQALAAIKDQLAMLKSQRLDISNRVDDFATEIYKTQEHCTTLKRQQQQASALAQVGSPGRALRRIKSLESRAQSCTNLNKIQHCSMDSSDTTTCVNEGNQCLPDENVYELTASPKRKRKTSVPSSIMQTISTNIFQFSPPTNKRVNAPFPLRRVSSNHANNRRSLQALETIHDNSPAMIMPAYSKDQSSMEDTDDYCDGDDTPDVITPASSPRLVRVHSINNIASKPPSKPLVVPCPSRSSSQTIYSSGKTNTGFSTLPCRKSSSNSSTVFDDNLSDYSCSIPDVHHNWDECSLRSEGSMVFRISSATGQVEKVSSRMITPTGTKQVRTSYSLEKVNAPLLDNTSCASRRAHYLHHQLKTTNKTCLSSSSTDNEDMDILTLNEEPRPLSASFESSSTFSIPREVKRTSLLLPSIETTV